MIARRHLFLLLAALALAARPAAAQAPAGDPMAGRALFIGARPLENGAAPCGACHGIGGQGAAFAASLGPSLSASFDGLDAAAVDGMLEDPPFPTMAPIYGGHPLTPVERTDLTAFLLQAGGEAAPGGGRVAAYAALVAAAGLAFVGLLGRRRKGSTRAELLARARLVPPGRPRPAPEANHGERGAPPAARNAQGEGR
jgi:mono/diheme cytochrome c family protein